ncbi:MAG: metallophosphoesterase [bacterium]|nr:metallophosphoesterase [bacterium]
MEPDSILFARAIAHANRLRPEFVVVCGDLVNRPGDPAQIAELLRVAGGLDRRIPLRWVAGNHDLGNTPTAESLERYRATFGLDWYSFDRRGCHFVVLDSCLLRDPDCLPGDAARQWEWLQEDLADAARRAPGRASARIIVFMHHSLFLNAPDEEDQYFNIPRARRGPLLELLHRHGVEAVFSGHYHRCAAARDGAMEVVTTGPVGRPLGPDPSGLRVVRIFLGGLAHDYYSINAVPASIDLEDRAPSPARPARKTVPW